MGQDTRQSATVWHRAWQEEGVRGLRQAERAGRPPVLTTTELGKVERASLAGPAAYGWRTELWTLERVADVIAMETGVRYHVGHVWKILRRLGWSWQKAARRATERDEEAIARWVREEWPEIKKLARRKQAWIVFEDESGASLTPVVRRTWAPRDKTPVLHHPFNWKRISMAAALAYRWDGARTWLDFQTQDGNHNEESLIEFIRDLRRHFRGEQVILLWDGLALASEPDDDPVLGRAAALA